MRRAFKRASALLLAMVMCLGLLPVSTLAAAAGFQPVVSGDVVVNPAFNRSEWNGDVLMRITRSHTQKSGQGPVLMKYDYDHTEPCIPIIVGDISGLPGANDVVLYNGHLTGNEANVGLDNKTNVFGRYAHSTIYIGQTVSGAMVTPKDGGNTSEDNLYPNQYHPFRIKYTDAATTDINFTDRPIGIEIRIYERKDEESQTVTNFQRPTYEVTPNGNGSFGMHFKNNMNFDPVATYSYGFCADRNDFQLLLDSHYTGNIKDSVYLYNQTDDVRWTDSSNNPGKDTGFDTNNGVYYQKKGNATVARVITEKWAGGGITNSTSPCLLGYDVLDPQTSSFNNSVAPDGAVLRRGDVANATTGQGKLYQENWPDYMNKTQQTSGFTIMLAPNEYAEVTYTYNVASKYYAPCVYGPGNWGTDFNALTGSNGLNIIVPTSAGMGGTSAQSYQEFFKNYVGDGKKGGCVEFSNAASYIWYDVQALPSLGYQLQPDDKAPRLEISGNYVPFYNETYQQTIIAPGFYNADNANNVYSSYICMNHSSAGQNSQYSFTQQVKNAIANPNTQPNTIISHGLVSDQKCLLEGLASNLLYFNNSGLDDAFLGSDVNSVMNSGNEWYTGPYVTLGVCNNLSVLSYHRDGGVLVKKEASSDMAGKPALFLVTFKTDNLKDMATNVNNVNYNPAWAWFSGINGQRAVNGNILAGAGYGYESGRYLRADNFMSEADFKAMDHLTLLFKLVPGQVKRLIAPPGVQYDVREIKAYDGTNPNIYETYYDANIDDFRARKAEAFTSDFELTDVTAPKDGHLKDLPQGDYSISVLYTGRPNPEEVMEDAALPTGCTGYSATQRKVVGYSGNFTELYFQTKNRGEFSQTIFGDMFVANTPNFFRFNNGLDSRKIEIKKTVVDEAGSPTASDKTFTVSVELGANGTAKPTSLAWSIPGGADSTVSGSSGHIAVTAYKDGSALPDGSPLADADKITVTLMANDSVFLTFKGAFGSYCAITEENPGCAVTFKPSGSAFYTVPGSAAVNGDLAGPTSDTAPTVYFETGAIGSSKLEVVNSDTIATGITVSKLAMTGAWWPKEGGKYQDTAPGHIQFTYEGTERPTKVIFKDGEGNELSTADVAYIADANGKKTGSASDSNLTASGTKSFCLVVDPKDSINVQFESDAPVKCSLREIPQTGEPSGGLAVDISNGTVFHPDAEMAQTGESSLENGLDMAPSQKYYCEIGPDATGGRITYTNSAEEIKGTASVIIDYNLNGLAASRVEDMDLSDLLVSGKGSNVVPVDGVYDLNDTVSMDLINKSLTNNGQPLKAGDVVKIQFSGRNTNGDSVPLTLECKLDGVFADAKGTQKIDGAGYKITKPGTHVLYAHWTFTMTVPSSGTPIPEPSAQLKQIIWHDYWQGTTTTLYSYTTAETALGNGAIIDVGSHSGLLPGPIGRPGWSWYGWGVHASISEDELQQHPDRMFKALWMPAEQDYFTGLKAFVDGIFARTGYATIDLFSYWIPQPYSFNGNGGYFGKIVPGDFDDGTWQSKNEVNAGQKDGQGNIYRIWASADSEGRPTGDYFYYMNFAVLPRVQPYRIGYAFDGWFYDAAATIPMQEFETGLQPGRWYFAGWAAEDVTVTYHDTREGYGTTYTKTYKYGEALELLRGITDTSGQHFAGWSTSPDSTDTLADGGYLMKSDPKMNGCWYLETGRQDDLGTTSAVNGLDDAFGGALTRHDADHSGTADGGSDGGFYEPDADGGVTGTSHYWTLDLYSVWDPVTINYNATINYNDALNNDRARPTKMTLGLVSSVTNQLVETKMVDVELTAPQQIVTFDNGGEGFPTTTADASVEKATYRVYIKDYTDRNGKVHVIQDTTAQSGMMEMPTMSDGATTPVTSYAYALDNINQIDPGDAQLYTGQIYLNHNLVSTGTDVKFTLNFDDDSDNDGKRSSAVTLTLYADGVPVQDWHDMGDGEMRNAAVVSVNSGMCEVSADGNAWTYTFEDYQKYKDGKEIEYTVKVSDYNEDEYSIIYLKPSGGGSAYGCTLVHRNETRSVPVLIEWQDDYDRDQYRPESVDIQLTAYQYNRVTGEWESVQVKTATVKGDVRAPYWEYTFYGMKNNNDGEEIMYIADVISDPNALVPETSEKYTWTTQGAKNDETAKIVISKLGNTKSVPIRVSWADGNNNDGLRPSSIVLKLYADGKLVEGEDYSVVLSGGMTDDEWTYTFENLPVYREGESGVEIVYTISAEEAKPGDLYGEYEERGVLGEGHEFTKYVAEYPTKGGTFSPELAESSEAMVRLTHEINQIEVPVKITWMDSNNRDAMRPSYVTLALTAYQWNDETYKWEYVETATQTVKADGANTMTADEWTASFGLHDMYHDGVKIIYHLAVVSDLNEYLPEGSFEYGWVETAHGNQVDAVPEVTVSQNVNITSVTSTVFWDDSNNQDNIRPKNIILQLYAHAPGQTPEAVSGEAYRVNLSGDPTADNWTYTFSGMPKYAAGQSGIELIYTVRAIEAEGEPLYGYYIITANGGEEEVLRYEASYLHEDREAGTTENTLDADLSDRAYVKLSHVCETKTMNFSVNWHDDDDRDAMRMSSVSVDLYKTVGSGEPKYLRTLVITAGDNGTWTYKVTGLPGYEGGQPVKYTIEIPEDVRAQLAAGGYTATTEDNIVHLYHTPETGEIRTQLYWSDEDDNDGYRPDSVVAALYANGTPTGRTADLNEENNWSAAWTGLNAHYNQGAEHGLDIVYSVVIETPDGYTVAYNPADTTVEKNETLQIQLSHVKDTAEVPVNVFWNDTSNTDGKRPQNITVQLIADGRPTNNTLTLDAGNAGESENVWAGKFENMPVYGGDGEEIYYSLKVYDETTSTGGYSVMTAGTTLYLSYKPVKSSMYVSFQFSDGNNTDGRRPTGLYLQLKANGEAVDDSEYKHTVSFDTNVDGYFQNFGELPVYAADNTKIRYNVEVSFAPELGATDYDVWTSKDVKLSESSNAATNQIIVKLTRAVDETELTGHVYWFDCNDVEGNRPDALNIVVTDAYSGANVNYRLDAVSGEVYKVGTKTSVGKVNVSEWTGDSSVWTYTISGLPKNYLDKAGKTSLIYYYAKGNTAPIAMYYPTVYHGEDYGMDITLTHQHYSDYASKAAQDYTVNLMWLDNSNAWGYRPDSNGVKVELLANNEVYDTVYLTQADVVSGNANAWTHTWKSIPTYRNGEPVLWSVRAADVTNYTIDRNKIVATATASTVCYGQSVGFDFAVNWDDSDNDDAKRPETIGLDIYADGKKADTVILHGEGNAWSGEIGDMIVWRENDADAAVQYTFRWDAATEKYLSDNGYTARATMNGTDVESNQFYWLSANEFGNNEDEGYDSLTGKYGWETTLGYNKEKADYRFNVVFNDDADRDGLRPETVTVDLYADGVKVDSKTVEINKTDSDYPIVWNQMDVNEGGKPVVYTIKLSGKYNGYSVAYNELNTAVTLTHVPERVDVTGFVNWDDASGLVNVYNADGVYVRSYEQIARTDVWMQLFADGEAYGEPVLIPASEYGAGENLERTGSRIWENLLKYRDNGTEIVYTMTVESEGLDALLNDGYGRVYDMGTKYEPSVTISHDLYDICGTVYYLYTYSDDFLMKDVPVTAYRVGEDGTLTATGKQTRTDENGCFEFRNLPQGQYTIRATYKYGENTLAGTSGVTLDRQDASTRVVINRDAVNDSDYYDYTATGKAFYQTDSSDPATIKPVPADSIVLLYKLVDGETNPVYVGMTTTNEKGEYSFAGLKNADYVVNVVFMYENGVYTYDNADAMADGLRFPVVGADVAWNDIIKQVNGSTQPTPPTEDPDNPPTPPEEPEPCVVSGSVFYSDNGVHTEEPVADVDVYVYLRSNNAELGHVKTDENGRWTIEGLGVNEYTAVFSNQGNESRVLLFNIDESDYEAGTYEAAPQYFDRNSGKLTGTISGTVLNENGQPIRSLVAIYGDDGALKDFAYTDTNGDYLFTVLAGDNYNVKILAVEDERHEYAAGDPDDDLTTVDYYTLSGIFSVKGEPQPGQMVAIYQQNDGGEYDLILATLTDSEGRFSAKVYEEGNYRVCPYINSEIYEVRNVSVGYQEERPSVDVAVNGTYTVRGVEDYSSYKLYRSMNGVEELVCEEGPDGIVRSSYEILNLDAGTYRLELENGGKTTVYYFTCPEGTLVGVTYFVTVAGEVLDESGNAIIGAQVDIYNADGAKVRDTVIITADGKYEFKNLPEGVYQVVVTSPNTSSVIADKWTYEEDSYGKSYPADEGMAPGGNWTWNTNAFIVSGRVTFAGEDVGVEGAVVMFTRPSDLLFARSAYTDVDGYYRIGLAPGQYNLDARYEFDKDHIYTCVGTSSINLSADYNDANFTVYRHEVAISTVREADGAKMPNVDVTISYPDGTVFWTGKTDSEGLADVYVMPGEWVFKAKSGSVEAVKTVTVVDNMPVVLELDSMVYITGTVTDKDGNPVGDGIVYYESAGNSGNVYTDDEGKYVIAVPSDKLGGYTLSASQGEKTGDPVNVEVRGDVTVDLSVEPGSGSGDEGTKHHVSGIVTDETGKRLANADVTIVYGDDKDKTFTTSTNSNGEYGFNMPDGTYYLTASYDAGNGEVYSTNSETAVHVVGGDVTQNLTVLIGYETIVEVVDTEGRPVAGAKVLWTGTDKGDAETGDDGTVTLYLAKGTYWLHAETAGRVSPIVRHVVDGNGNVRLVLAKATIKDEPPVVEENLLKIWGYVNDPAGEPVDGATAKLYRYDLETMEWNLVDEKTTGADGYYEFPDLEDGKYRVDTEFTQTSNVVLGDGGYEISGVVADDMGRPQMNASVELYGPDGVIVSTVVTDEDGKYTFENVDPELEYTITVYDASGKKIVDNEAAPVGATRTNVTGTVADVAGNIVPGATVMVKDNEGNVVTTVTVGEDGKYDIAVSSPEDQYTVTITYPVGYEVDTETYERDTEDRNAPYLEPSWYTIRGEVHDIDGKPVEGAIVILKDKSKNEIDRVVTAADGKYVFDHLADGIYYVSVVIDGEEENEYRVDTGDEYENINVKVTNYAVRGTFAEPDGSWIAGENTFKVGNSRACGVFLVRDGNKPERLYASGNEGNTRLFTADLQEGDEIVIVVKGDVNLDGRVTVADLSLMNQVMSGTASIDEHATLAGDLNEDGRARLSVADLSLMNQLMSGNIATEWNEQ